MRFLFLSLIFISSNVFAESNIASLINSKGDLVITIIDRVNEEPYEASQIWSAMVGSVSTKKIKTPDFSMTCAASSPTTSGNRFASCRMVFNKEHVFHADGYYGGQVTDKIIQSNINDSYLSLMGGNLFIFADRSQNILRVKINESLVGTN
ncbi:MAG: hypothetical protein H6625_06980 [Bdellovibrionaceae bacterium]|nr:hypothetical protein [Pseudobdellovibrionaceae bacterium]